MCPPLGPWRRNTPDGDRGHAGVRNRLRTLWFRWFLLYPRVCVAAAGYVFIAIFAIGFCAAAALGVSNGSALAVGILAAGPLFVAVIWDRVTGVKAFGVEVTLAAVTPPIAGDHADVASALSQSLGQGLSGSAVGPTGDDLSGPFKELIQNQAKILRIDLRDDNYWWSTRMFLVAALAQDYTQVEALVSTPTPPPPGAPQNPPPHPHTATMPVCHRVSAYQPDAHRRWPRPPSRPAPGWASRRSCRLARSTFGGRQRAHRPISRPAPPIQPSTHRRQHLDHVAHQIIGRLAGIGHHDPPPLRRQRSPTRPPPRPASPPDPARSPTPSTGPPADPNRRADHGSTPGHRSPRHPPRLHRPVSCCTRINRPTRCGHRQSSLPKPAISRMPVHPNRFGPIRQIHTTKPNTLTHTQLHSTRNSSQPHSWQLTALPGKPDPARALRSSIGASSVRR